MRNRFGIFVLALVVSFPCLGSVEPSPDLVLTGDFTVRFAAARPTLQFTGDRWDHYWLVRENGVLTLYVGDDRRGYRTIGTAKAWGAIATAQLPRLIETWPAATDRLTRWWIENEAVHPKRC